MTDNPIDGWREHLSRMTEKGGCYSVKDGEVKKVGRPRIGTELRTHKDREVTKICTKCDQKKEIKLFARGHGKHKKRDVCRECGSLPETKWNFGGSVRAKNKSDRVDSDSDYFDKKTPSLSIITDQACMLNDRDYIKTEKDE